MTKPISSAVVTARQKLDAATPRWAYRRDAATGPETTWKWTTKSGEWRLAIQASETIKLNGVMIDVMLPCTQYQAMIALMEALGAIATDLQAVPS